MRCDGSAQCIKRLTRCDGPRDCVNGWDEALTTCYSEEQQLRFADDSGLQKQSYTNTINSLHLKCEFLGLTYNITIQPIVPLELYDESGLIGAFAPDDCPCTVEHHRASVFSITANASADAAFIMYI